MYRSLSLSEDQALKETVANRAAASSPFAWREILATAERNPIPEITVTRAGNEEQFSLADVADAIGESLTNLLISRETPEDDIFSEQNRSFVSAVAHRVSKSLMNQVQRGGNLKLSQNDLYLLIEKALIENDAYDVAKSLIFKRSLESTGEISLDAEPQEQIAVRLIRRNGNVVPWSESKIEQAVARAFLTLKEDPAPALAVARAVTDRVKDGDQAFVHIEDVQDIVQEELMKQGHYKVAAHYVRYRDERARLRAENPVEVQDPAQESFVTVTTDGASDFWDGAELKKRIQFAMIGLKLSMTEEQIEHELRRSIGAEISREDLKKTIILNSKTLLEKDADMSKFAGRILLSYIYEEVLPWNIQVDGIESLKEAHRQNFKAYLLHGVEIGRLSRDLLDKYDIERLADALDPSADLDFDFLGISTLYDRYLNVDKTGDKPRRMETPQFFWMRVSMGLFKAEKTNAEDWVIRLYNLYKGRRFCSSTPTLFNSGTLHSQLSSCYLYKVDDSIESIMHRGIAENAFLSKWAGGLGGSWTAVRGTGGYIQGTNGESQGVIPFLKLHNDQLIAVNQGGKRRGSGCAYLESWHNDIEDFLELRVNTGDERRRTH
ncbi:MAG TPA: ribonucleoside-diphosphate reductase subunit alpha, partial [Verrucomicrobiales bacterium]|nr:ribonucleoside-diphosphate reductase subunit alpha [Verrucomicrobiales bacterium]